MSFFRLPPLRFAHGLAALLLAGALGQLAGWRAEALDALSLLPPPPLDASLQPPPLMLLPPPGLENPAMDVRLRPEDEPPPPATLLGPPLAINPGRGGGAGAGGFKPEDLMIKPLGTIGDQRPGEIDRNAQLVGASLRHPFPTAFLPLSKGNYYVVNSAYGGREIIDARYPGDSALYAGLGLGDPYRWLGLQAELGVPSVNNLDYGTTLDLKLARDVWNTPNLRIGVSAGWLSAANSGYSALNQSTQYGVVTTAWRLNTPALPYDRIVHLNVGFGAPTFGDLSLSNQQLFTSIGIETSPRLGFSAGFNADGLLLNSTMRF